MNRIESLPLVVSLVIAASLMGWIVQSQRPMDPVETTQAPPPVRTQPVAQVPSVDEVQAAELRTAAEGAPEDFQVRVDLGNLYFDAHRFDEAVPWFEAALALNPEDVDVSTDLGMAYYYLDDADRALTQFARSLQVDPAHVTTILNLGIVRAFGKRDLEGAIEAWEEVQRVAPGSPEALATVDALDRIRSAHP